MEAKFSRPSTRRTAGNPMQSRQRTALLRGAPHTDCAAQHARAKRACAPGLLGGSNDNRSLDIATSTSARGRGASKTLGWKMQTPHWGLTFDMSGRLKL